MKKLVLLSLLLLGSCTDAPKTLRVCADPNNLPFSNRALQGFENRIAALVAGELGRTIEYVWWAQRRGNVRETLNAGLCDLIPGVAAGLEMLSTTRPYYSSSYVAVSRAGRGEAIGSFDDPRLRDMKIGVQMIGDDFANTPPAHALSRRGIIANVRGFMVYGDYSGTAPQADIIEAVASGDIDVAFVWGPVAGYFARQSPIGLEIRPLGEQDGVSEQPMAFAVAMGVRRRDEELKAQVEKAIEAKEQAIRQVLAGYHVPLVASAPPPADDDD